MRFKQIASLRHSKFLETSKRYCGYLNFVASDEFDPKQVVDDFYEALTPEKLKSYTKEMIAVDLKIMDSRFKKSGFFDQSVHKGSMSVGHYFRELIRLCDYDMDSNSYLVPIELFNFATGKIGEAHYEDLFLRDQKLNVQQSNFGKIGSSNSSESLRN